MKILLARLLANVLLLGAAAVPAFAQTAPEGAVYTMTNAASGNAVLAFARGSDGRLAAAGSFPTAGTGTGSGLGNQGGLVLDANESWLLAVNAGSGELSVFAVTDTNLTLTDKKPSGGAQPVSVSVHRGLVYVLNAGSDNLFGFRLDGMGQLQPIAGSMRPLSGTGTGAAQVQFSPDGNSLLVTEKSTNRILVYPVGADGLLGTFTILQSPTPTPFGFAFGKRDQFFVSEAAGGAAGASTLSSYQLDRGTATLVTASAPTHQTAACWVVVTNGGQFAYTSNTGSGTLSGFAIASDGRLRLLNADGVTASTGAGSGPIDMAFSRGSKFLYSLNGGNGSIGGFRVGAKGQLAAIGGEVFGLPSGANGLAAR